MRELVKVYRLESLKTDKGFFWTDMFGTIETGAFKTVEEAAANMPSTGKCATLGVQVPHVKNNKIVED